MLVSNKTLVDSCQSSVNRIESEIKDIHALNRRVEDNLATLKRHKANCTDVDDVQNETHA